MEFALQAALLGAVVGSAVLAVATLYALSLPAGSGAFAWWAAAFMLDAASEGLFLTGAAAAVAPISDVLHGCSAVLIAAGAATFLGRPPRWGWAPAGLLAVVLWGALAGALRLRLGLAGVPLFGIGGLPVLVSAWAFLACRQPIRPDGHKGAAVAFAAGGIHHLAGPLLALRPALATWGLVAAQLAAMLMAVALLLVVLRRQQAATEREVRRAALLDGHLAEALGGIQDGVAIYDAGDRLVTCNDRYREILAPFDVLLVPGMPLRDLLEATAIGGLVPTARGREDEWVGSVMAGHASRVVAPQEQQMSDGRWMAVSVYPTSDGGHLRILSDITERKQAELALTESATWLRGVMDAVVDGLVAIDDQGAVLSVNPAVSRIFGYPPEEILGRDIGMLIPEAAVPADGAVRFPTIGIHQATGRRRDGTLFPLELALSELAQHQMVTFIAVLRDITGRKRVEAALVDSEQRFRDLAESASDWFWETDGDLRFVYVSGRVTQVLGVGPGFFLGHTFEELMDSSLEGEGWEAQRLLMAAGRPFRGFVVRHRLPSGGYRYVEMAGRPVLDAAGTWRGYRGTASDITILKRHERDLAEQSALRQAIIDNMGQGVVVFDGAERLVAVNSAARRLLDLPESELGNGLPYRDFLRHIAPAQAAGEGAACLAMRLDPGGMFELPRPAGAVLEVRSTAMPGGGLIQTLTDITERKHTEDTLREAKEAAERGNRAKATFLANISHELRTPLNAIIGFSELMRHEIFGPLEPAAYRTYIDDINESGMHLLELINDILDISKAEAGMTDLIEGDVDVAQIVRSSARMMARRAEMQRVEVIEDLEPDLPRLRADERRLRQIVLNLISNAVKFTDENGQVVVTARSTARGMEIKVVDTGIGMTEAEMERVMEPFVQADSRLSRKYEGTGLGLPLSKALVEAHGGTLVLTSTPGVGTTVTATFPLERLVAGGLPALTADSAGRN